MSQEDPLETVTISTGVDADRLALTVRSDQGGRFEWAEISRFEDGLGLGEDNRYFWRLAVVLHSGRKVQVSCEPSSETLAVIREVARRHGIPADLPGHRL